MKKTIFLCILTLSLVLGTGLSGEAAVLSPELEKVLKAKGPDDEISVIVTLSEKADFTGLNGKGKGHRRAEMVKALVEKANLTQKPIREFLKQKNARRVSPLWIINGMAVTARAEVIDALAKRPGIESIRFDDLITLSEPVATVPETAEWNLDMILATPFWQLGFRGAGVVIASMDTGVDVNHPDLAAKFRGGSNSWFDPNNQHTTPYDMDSHGTRTMGIMVGGTAGGSAIGVAPDAKWIAVKIFNDAGSASLSGIHSGFQWLLDPDGNPATDDAPDVVNNSWGFNQLENVCYTEFQEDIQVLKLAEIAVVFSGGNEGPSGYSSVSPANYPESFTVGAVDSSYAVAGFSSRGPSACDDGIYPEVTAPGVNIRTSDLTLGGLNSNPYVTVSGTSFAAPHVAGAMALLLNAMPQATVAELEQVLMQSAMDLGTDGPDHDSGYGLLDVMGAYDLMNQEPVLCEDSDEDGFSAMGDCVFQGDCNDNDPDVYPGAIEVKHDGIDQDCNGYDLTIDITSAVYSAKKGTLSVQATSSLGKTAGLELVGYGAMSWNRKTQIWTISKKVAGGNPGTVTVSGIEGSDTIRTIAK